ncbi:MAG TPA: endonuclease/exonuclease/phosphatase family protein [Mycobacteriales bacterium]|nr:endonuclease/exonuclease/phosphatase family protein [Mycobacteriales bacterium]
MRVVTWNVRSLRDSRADVVDVLRTLNADVVCLQEMPRFAAPRREAARLAADCGLVVASAGPPVAALGILVAPRVRVGATLRQPLPWAPGRHRRGLVRAVVELGPVRAQVATVHLGLDLEERERHARIIRTRLRDNRLPAVLAGDLNETDTFPAWRLLADGMQDAWLVAGHGTGRTFSTARPRRRIDAVFVDAALSVSSCEVPDGDEVTRASDHRPVVCDVGWLADTV